MKMMKSLLSMTVIACGAMAVVSCNNSDDIVAADLSEYQSQVYSQAFADEFGQPAADQNWGFGSFSIKSAEEPIGSSEYFRLLADAVRQTRAVAETVTGVSPKTYSNADEVMAETEVTAYFYLRIDNNIVLQELNGVQNNPKEAYYPKPKGNLGNGINDTEFNTDNEGTILTSEWEKLGLTINNNGITYATKDQPIPLSIFGKYPSFEAMALHVPDADKIELAGSVDAFMSNYKIFWYVAKWQNSDKIIHVDGVLVPKDQITVNVPEYKKRIIVEDLKGNISTTTKVNSSDFDFNDVVFDAVTWKVDGKNHLKIIVRAAGGRLPIYIDGVEIHDGIGYMFNTSNPDYEFGKVLIEDKIIDTEANAFDFNSIPVEIEINGQKHTAGANIGVAPEKVAVHLDYKWCKEKENIKTIYPRFSDYVADKGVTGWWK